MATLEESSRWDQGRAAGPLMVLAVASAGWVFDVYEGQLFTIFHRLERVLQPWPRAGGGDPARPRNARGGNRATLGCRRHVGLVLGGLADPLLRPRDAGAGTARVKARPQRDGS